MSGEKRYDPPSGGGHGGGYGAPGSGPPGMRASAADRDQAVDLLKEAFGDGRLTKDEFDDRCDRVMNARTYGDLSSILADLPGGRAFSSPPPYSPLASSPFPPVTQVRPTSGLATGALLCGILEVFTMGMTSVPAVVLGHMARNEIRRTGKRGDGMAVAGLALGYLAIAVWVVALITVAAVRSHSGGP